MKKRYPKRPCSVPGCTALLVQAGLCGGHFKRYRKYGDALAGPPIKRRVPPRATLGEAFAFYMGERLPETDRCIPWRGTIIKTNGGYGSVMLQGKNTLAHRISYKLFVGPLGDRELVRHTCDNPPCVNPRHLLSGSKSDNMRDALERGLVPLGTDRARSRLNPDSVREIRALYQAGAATQAQLAKKHGVSASCIQFTLNGRNWKHVD